MQTDALFPLQCQCDLRRRSACSGIHRSEGKGAADAGHYCGETCMCHNCHNTQDHKDLVTQTIAYTRSRNPASFEAKVASRPPPSASFGTPEHK